ncbi:MAG: tetratricopeptide repeat protein [Planctomycetota bacterium]
MPRDPDRYDLFISYARHDNRDGWISRFVDELRRASGGLTCFVDQHDIRSLDDWRLKIHDSLAQSRLLLAFVSPHYFASEWCRREWRTWIDHEIAKHILASGAAPVIVVEVPGLTGDIDERQVARVVAELCALTAPHEPFVEDAAGIIKQLRRRQFTPPGSAVKKELRAFDRAELQTVLARLGADLTQRAEQVRQAALSESTVPLYNRKFTGRLDELLLLRKRLQDDRAGVISGVHGLGGIGKTELAFTFAHAFAGEYPGGRFLIPCERHDSLRRAVLHLGDRFRDQISDEQRMTVESYFSALAVCLQRRLATHGRILLVLDNVTDLRLLRATETDALTALGPQLHLLATTREATGKSSGIQWLTLGELTESESVELLEKHREFANADERLAAQRIARRLGGFSLAVELVAAWLAEHPSVTCEDCLQRLGLEDLETLDDLTTDPNAELRRHNHERRLQAVLGPTLAALTPAARRALEFAALLSPDHVPLRWLQVLVANDLPEVSTEQAIDHIDPWQELCRELFRLALFTRGEAHQSPLVRVHRLVQSLILHDLPMDIAIERQHGIVELVKARDRVLENTIRWQDARWELEPLEALAKLWAGVQHAEASWLLHQIGHRWENLAEWTRAEPLQRLALVLAEQFYGADHPKVANRLNSLAQLIQATNRLSEAEPMLRRALAIDEQFFGNDHADIAIRLNNLAVLLLVTFRFSEAEQMLRRALAIDERYQGGEHTAVARDLSNLADVLRATNRLSEAEPLMRRALAIDEKSFGCEHPTIAIRLSNLALLLEDTNRASEAEPMLRRALAISENAFGNEHPSISSLLNNLSTLLMTANRHTEAEPLIRRALSIDERCFGNIHPDIARDLNNLAQLLKAIGRLREAEPLMRRALEIDEQSFGIDHPNVARDLNNLAQLLKATNRLEGAEPLMRRALAIFVARLGIDHPNSLAVRQNYDLLLRKLGGAGSHS